MQVIESELLTRDVEKLLVSADEGPHCRCGFQGIAKNNVRPIPHGENPEGGLAEPVEESQCIDRRFGNALSKGVPVDCPSLDAVKEGCNIGRPSLLFCA